MRLSLPGMWLVSLAAIFAAASAPPAAGQPGMAVTIASPADEETVHDNTGRLAVALTVDDGGALTQGRAALRVLLDGAPLGPDQRVASFTLDGIERGTHSLQVQLVDAGGRILAASAVVTFHMWQASRLFRGRKAGP